MSPVEPIREGGEAGTRATAAGVCSVLAVILLVACSGHVSGRRGTCGPVGDDAGARDHLEMGRCWEGAGHDDRALPEYRKAVSLSPHDTEARLDLALGYIRTGEDLFAARELLLLLDDDPDNVTALYKLGGIFYRIGKMDLAITSFSRVLEIDPGNSRARYNLGAIYANRGDRKKAEEYFRAYLDAAPGSAENDAVRRWLNENDPQDRTGTRDSTGMPLQ